MASKTVTLLNKSQRIDCDTCVPSPVILCLADNLVATEGQSTINADLISATIVRNSSGAVVGYRYTFSYDDIDIIDQQKLESSDILGVICAGCLITYIDEKIATTLAAGFLQSQDRVVVLGDPPLETTSGGGEIIPDASTEITVGDGEIAIVYGTLNVSNSDADNKVGFWLQVEGGAFTHPKWMSEPVGATDGKSAQLSNLGVITEAGTHTVDVTWFTSGGTAYAIEIELQIFIVKLT